MSITLSRTAPATGLPTLHRTIVTEIKITLADLKTRTLICKLAGAAAMVNTPLNSTNVIITPTSPFTIPHGVERTLVIACNNPVTLLYYDYSDTVIMTQIVTNQYAFNGSIANKIVITTATVLGTALQLVYG